MEEKVAKQFKLDFASKKLSTFLNFRQVAFSEIKRVFAKFRFEIKNFQFSIINFEISYFLQILILLIKFYQIVKIIGVGKNCFAKSKSVKSIIHNS